jgi:hypothetical protein
VHAQVNARFWLFYPYLLPDLVQSIFVALV